MYLCFSFFSKHAFMYDDQAQNRLREKRRTIVEPRWHFRWQLEVTWWRFKWHFLDETSFPIASLFDHFRTKNNNIWENFQRHKISLQYSWNNVIAVPSSLRLTKTEKEQNCPKLKRLNMNKTGHFYQMHNQILAKIVQHSLWSKQELLFISMSLSNEVERAMFFFKL